jgi:hypothetical protein
MSARVNPFFTPTQISGCQLWLDAADPTTLSLSGSNVTQWRDKSGNGRNATGYNTTATFNPNGLNTGYSALEFSSTKSMQSSVASGTFSSAASGFIVYKFTGSVNLTAAYGLFSRTVSPSNGVPTPFDMYSFSNATYRSIGNGTVFTQSTASPNYITQSNASQYNFSIQSSATTTWNESVNGTVATLTSSGGTGAGYGDTGSTVLIGGRLDTAVFFQGVISEVILYNISITTLQRQQVEGYLAWKWGLQSSLPANHPYKNSPIAPLGNPPTTPAAVLQNTTPTWIPTQISGCSVWLDAADLNGNGTRTANGATVTTWVDKSPARNNYTNSGTVTYTNNAVYFAGSSYMQNTSVTGFPFGGTPAVTTFIVFSYVNASSTRGLFSYGTVSCGKTGYVLYVDIDNKLYGTLFCGDLGINTSVSSATTYIVSDVVTYTGTPGSLTRAGWLNGSTMGVPTASATGVNLTNSGASRVGDTLANQLYFGSISEVLFYNTSLTTTQRQQVEGYLAWKWNLQANLPNTHPFKASPPFVPASAFPARSLAQTAGFNPLRISGCSLWLDAADQASLILSGTNVSQWNDKSGQGNTGSNAGTVSLSTFNSRQMISFNGNSAIQGSYTNSGTTITCFGIFVPQQSSYDNTRVVSFTNAPGVLDFVNTSALAAIILDVGGAVYTQRNISQVNTTTNFTTNALNLASVLYTGSSTQVFLNGGGQGSGSLLGSFGTTLYGIGGYAGFNPSSYTANKYTGLVGEVLVYNSALLPAQRQQVEGYLAWKWGLQGSLPANHPWKNWPPPP